MPRKAIAWVLLWFVLWVAACGCQVVPRHATLKVRVLASPVATELTVDAAFSADPVP